MEKYFEILRACALFEHIEQQDIFGMLSCLGAKAKEYSKKQVVFARGQPARYVGVVLSGSVRIEQLDYSGQRSIVSTCQPADIFAESFACAGGATLPVSAVCARDSSVLLIDSARIMAPCDSSCHFHRQLIYNLMKIIAAKNIRFHRKLDIISRRTTKEKLLAYLSYMAAENNSRSFYIPFSRQELADYLEVDRSGLSVRISRLKKEGMLECDKNFFCLLGETAEGT